MPPPARDEFIALLRSAVRTRSLVKLTLGKAAADPALKNLFVRPVNLKAGPQFAFVWRYATRDVAKNHSEEETLALIEPLIGADFLDAHLFTERQTAQLECGPEPGAARLRLRPADPAAPQAAAHDRKKEHPIPSDAPWLNALGVTDAKGRPRTGMADKFRQIQKFAELLGHLVSKTPLPADRELVVADMGSGKGYLTFAVAALLGTRARVVGVEARADLVDLCNRVAAEAGMAPRLSFQAGTIDRMPVTSLDILIGLHACDTATDDALAKGIAGGAALLVVAPCCQKELRPALVAPPVLAEALKHGIFLERQAEFVTDALRAQLLEWAGYRTKVFEFVSTEHTAKNTLIAAVKARPAEDPALAGGIRSFAAFYGVRSQKLADHLEFPLA